MTILDRIVETKREEVAEAKRRRPFDEVREAAGRTAPPRPFASAIAASAPSGIQLIAEIKKSSPSAGLIVKDFDPVTIARVYHKHGAAAVSVLTDETHFDGRLAFIEDVKQAVPLPVLRKDFIVDKYQIHESRAANADAILLIAEVLEGPQIVDFTAAARNLGMAVLVEVHSEETLAAVLDALGPPSVDRYLLGINNRDLSAQKTDLSTMKQLSLLIPDGLPFVAESGIATRADVEDARKTGACAILVGEAILRADDMGAKIDELLGT